MLVFRSCCCTVIKLSNSISSSSSRVLHHITGLEGLGGSLVIGRKLGLHQCSKKGVRKVHREFGCGVVERGVGKKWMG